MDQCDCGADAGPLGLCEDYYYAILGEEQGDPEMYRWHAPVVCAYLLQHPSRGHAKYLDTQFRLLQLCLDQGIEALLRVASHQVARNRHGVRSGYDMAPLEPYAPLPEGPPERFRTGFAALPCDDGSFVARGHEDYGRRMTAIAQATVDAWFGRPAG